MSSGAKAPKGYTNKSVKDLQQESQQLLFQLGQAYYNEEFSIREQNRIQDALEKMEEALQYAKKQEDAKAIEENNKKVRADSLKAKKVIQETSVGGQDDQTVSNSGT